MEGFYFVTGRYLTCSPSDFWKHLEWRADQDFTDIEPDTQFAELVVKIASAFTQELGLDAEAEFDWLRFSEAGSVISMAAVEDCILYCNVPRLREKHFDLLWNLLLRLSQKLTVKIYEDSGGAAIDLSESTRRRLFYALTGEPDPEIKGLSGFINRILSKLSKND